MPRVLAALIAEGIAVAVLIGAAIIVLPPLVSSTVDVVSRLPTGSDAQAAVAQLEGQFGSLPEPLRGISLAVLTEVVTNLQATLQGIVDGLGDFLTNQILGILDTVSFVLGLFVIPVWILTVVADEHRIKQRAASLVTPALRADVAALVRIADRALSTFLRVRVAIGLATALFVWLGLIVARELGLGEFRFAAAGATLVGPPAAHPGARVLPRVLPARARVRDRRPGARPHRGGRVRHRGAGRVDPARDAPVPGRARRPPGAPHPGDRRDEPARPDLAADRRARPRDRPRHRPLPGRPARRPAEARRRHPRRARVAGRHGRGGRIPSVYRHRAAGPRLAVASTLPPAVPVAAVAGAAAAQAAATRRTTQP